MNPINNELISTYKKVINENNHEEKKISSKTKKVGLGLLENDLHSETSISKEKKINKKIVRSNGNYFSNRRLLRFLQSSVGENNWKGWRRGVKKMGGGLNSKLLLASINQISNAEMRHKATQKFLKLQLSMVGHEFGMGGEIKIKEGKGNFVSTVKNFFKSKQKNSSTVKEKNHALEGWFKNNAHAKMTASVAEFFDQTPLPITHSIKKTIIDSLKESALLSRGSLFKKDSSQTLLKSWKTGKPVTIPTGWSGHAVEVTLYKDYLAYSNRGESKEEFEAGIHIYKIGNKEAVNSSFIKKLLYEGMGSIASRKEYFEGGVMKEDLSLKEFTYIKKADQKVGNCAWASTKCALHAEIFFLKLDEVLEEKKLDKSEISQEEIETISIESNDLFKNWESHNKMQSLNFFMDMISKINSSRNVLSARSEFQLFSEILYKFADRRKFENFLQTNPTLVTYLDEVVATFFDKKTFGIEDMTVDLSMINRPNRRVVRPLLMGTSKNQGHLPGSFILYKGEKDGGLALAALHEEGKVHIAKIKTVPPTSLEGKTSYKLILNNVEYEIHSLDDINNAIKINNGRKNTTHFPLIKYPISNQKLFEMLRD